MCWIPFLNVLTISQIGQTKNDMRNDPSSATSQASRIVCAANTPSNAAMRPYLVERARRPHTVVLLAGSGGRYEFSSIPSHSSTLCQERKTAIKTGFTHSHISPNPPVRVPDVAIPSLALWAGMRSSDKA